MSDAPIVLHIRPVAEAARYVLDHLDDIGSDWGRIVALDRIAQDLIAEVAAAEARGYDRAIATLRDESAFGRWRTARFLAHRDDPDYVTPTRGDQAADYLESLKETNDAV